MGSVVEFVPLPVSEPSDVVDVPVLESEVEVITELVVPLLVSSPVVSSVSLVLSPPSYGLTHAGSANTAVSRTSAGVEHVRCVRLTRASFSGPWLPNCDSRVNRGGDRGRLQDRVHP